MTTQENLLARHRILHEIGRGTMGAVYAARDRTTGALVALKRLDPQRSESDAGLARRFLEQARSARRLKHRNIVAIHDAGEAAGTAYVAMEMLEGESLRTILDRGPLPIARALRIAHEVASGLAHAHLEGAVHGSLKPSNVIVLRSGAAKITDFGIGTGGPGYISPEQVRGDPVDHRADIFSLGALFYEMLTGRRPFEGDSPKAAPPSELNPHVPRALDGVVSSMLAGQAAERMPGVPLLLRELQRLEEGLGLEAGAGVGAEAPAATSVPPVAPSPKPRPMPEPAPRAPDPSRFQEREPMREGPRFVQPEVRPRDPALDHEAFDYHRAMMARGPGPGRPSQSWTAIIAPLVLVLAVVGIGTAALMHDWSGIMRDWSSIERRIAAASRVQEAPVAVRGASRATVPSPVAEATREPIAPPVESPAPPPPAADEKAEPASSAIPPPPEPISAKPLARAPEPPAPARPAPAKRLPLTTQQAAAVPAQPPGGTARVILAVSPRGELYINGEHHGTTPPTTTLDLAPGMYRVEVRSGSRKPFLTYMTVEAGDVRRIRHDFNAKPIRPPY
jgi:serine/threonine protein kinase